MNNLENRFNFHPADEQKQVAHEHVRTQALAFAVEVDVMLVDGYEKDQSIAKIEEAMMWANAGIARNAKSDATKLIGEVGNL